MSRVAALLMLVLCTVGCGKTDPLKRIEVSGSVTYNGTPIADGDITFFPEAGTNAPPGSGDIRAGAYRLTGRTGLVAGTYSVRINSYREFASKELSPGGLDRPQSIGGTNKEQILPVKFNAKTTIEKITISGDAPVTKDFTLKD